MVLFGLTIFFVATSWRKWPDPLVDFGRELYLPWRLANGAVLFRDVDDSYGPLSQYFNAALFKCFGPGLMVLVTANLVVFAAIAVLIYQLFRRAWGVVAAQASMAVFIAVFGFSQLVDRGNYNYATPYAHEATHGFLICLVLVTILIRWVEEATLRRTFAAGLLFGLTAVLKPEIMLAAGLVTFAVVVVGWRQRKKLKLCTVAVWAGGAILPTLGFVVFFAVHLPWGGAVRASCRAWLNLTPGARFTNEAIQAWFLGFDRPEENFLGQVCATLQACGLIGLIAGAAFLAGQTTRKRWRFILGGLLVGVLLWLSCFVITWREVGQCLPGLVLIYILIRAAVFLCRTAPETIDRAAITRLLLATLAAALLARMALHGRIYQYGFYQAALAALLVPAVLIGEVPAWLGTGRCGRTIITLGCLSLLVPGVVILAVASQRTFGAKTVEVGEGADRFYAFVSERDPTGAIVTWLSDQLRSYPPGQTLVVLPEGVMINYLARMPSPRPQLFFFSSTTRDGLEAEIVKALQQHPPDWIVIISRDLREYGVNRYGEKPGSGQLILHWVADNYTTAASLGDDPLDYRQYGGLILKRKKSN